MWQFVNQWYCAQNKCVQYCTYLFLTQHLGIFKKYLQKEKNFCIQYNGYISVNISLVYGKKIFRVSDIVHRQIGHSFDNFLAQSVHAIKCPHGLTAWVKGLSRQITHLPIGSVITVWSLLELFRSSTRFCNKFCFLDSISCFSCKSFNCFCTLLSSPITIKFNSISTSPLPPPSLCPPSPPCPWPSPSTP